jgi:acetyl esterase/lipase
VGVVTVSPEYRLAPEHPWPAAADDCEAVARWLVDHAGDRFGTDRLLVAGGSAGAHLAMVTLLRLRDAGLIDRFDAANLGAGVFDVGLTPSQRASADGLSIPLRVLEACNRMTFPGLDREQRRDPSISPLYADLHGLPPALLTVGTRDPLLDDSLFLHRRLQAAGVDAELAVFPDGSHTFVTSETPLAEAAKARIHAFLDTHLA